ncbi:ABC transporter permease [Methylobacterium variabile]|jgi:branched-chain amino acid transport system substrate-binding protein|uniref:ABC transporter permease n=1 Tax=Methylobacterium variabile TaxID=298794 RepID=A0A0J6T4A4_9HYPH|nr:ABC transporter substrate-binding protein [Methylobacterium variabile]KMO40418.1 ABC transporter permease [Methylobacterium variabile]
MSPWKAVIAGLLGVMSAADAQAQIRTKIGVLNDRSGVYADITGEGSAAAARMAVEDFKAREKGIEVTVVGADHQNKPDIGANVARSWYDKEGVDVIVDVPTSSVALAVNEITREKNKILLVSGGATSDLTGKACSPNTIHWTFDTYALSRGTGGAMVRAGGDTWFFVTADYAFGHALERDTEAVVLQAGGKVVGKVRHPFPGQDFSSFLIQAQGSGAKVVGLANAGGDTINAIKQAKEFGITQGGQKLAGLLVFSSDIQAIGLDVAQGLVLTEAYYSDLNDKTRDFAERFARAHQGRNPTSVQAGVYSSVLHYLKAVHAVGSKEAGQVLAKMKQMPTNDPVFGPGSIREDGRKMHTMYLFQVKSPAESKGRNDIYKLISAIPPEQAFRPLAESNCRLVARSQ